MRSSHGTLACTRRSFWKDGDGPRPRRRCSLEDEEATGRPDSFLDNVISEVIDGFHRWRTEGKPHVRLSSMVTQGSNRIRIHTDHSALGDVVNVAFDRYLAAGRRDEHFFLAVVRMRRRHGVRFDDLIHPHHLTAERVRELPDLRLAGIELFR